MNIEQNEIFNGRHKELDENKFNSIIKDIEDFAELAKYSDTALWRLMNIMMVAKVEYEIVRR